MYDKMFNAVVTIEVVKQVGYFTDYYTSRGNKISTKFSKELGYMEEGGTYSVSLKEDLVNGEVRIMAIHKAY